MSLIRIKRFLLETKFIYYHWNSLYSVLITSHHFHKLCNKKKTISLSTFFPHEKLTIKINRARTISVDFGNNSIEFTIGQLVVEGC